MEVHTVHWVASPAARGDGKSKDDYRSVNDVSYSKKRRPTKKRKGEQLRS